MILWADFVDLAPLILPIALPDIFKGIALDNAFRTVLGMLTSMWTLVIAHATFCIVVVFNL
jgi:putative spermidine/putrescine transport system permease protein